MNKLKYNWEQAWNNFKELPKAQRSIIANIYFVSGGIFAILFSLLLLVLF